MRPSVVAIVAVHGEVDVIDAVSAASAPGRVAAGDRDVEVDPWSAEVAVAIELLGLAEHQVGEGQRVDAHVEQGAAAERPGRASGRRRLRRRRSRGRRAPGAGSPNSPAASPSRTSRITGWQAIHMASIRNRSARAASGDQLLGVGGVERERLLAEHVLAGLEGQPGVARRGGRAARRRTRRRRRGPRPAPRRSRTPPRRRTRCANAVGRSCERGADRGELGAGDQRAGRRRRLRAMRAGGEDAPADRRSCAETRVDA